MPSFDVVSEVDLMEVKNALDQANKELANRFDFREAKAEIVLWRQGRDCFHIEVWRSFEPYVRGFLREHMREFGN